MDYDQVIQLSPEQLNAALGSIYGQDKGYFLGGYVVGFLVDAIFLGVVFHQFVHWWQWSRKEDRLIVQLLVYFSMAMSIGISIYLAVWIFHMFVNGFGNYTVFIEVEWMSVWFLLDVVVRVPVQAFFASRAWGLSGRKTWFAGLIAFLYIAALGTGITVKVLLPIPAMQETAQVLILIWLAIEILSDVITTTTIAYCLWTSRTGWSGTDKLIGRLLRLILETQFPPTVFAICFLCIYVTAAAESSATRFFVCSPKVYAICLFAVLNSRHTLRADLSAEQTYTKGNSYVLRGMRGANTGINVTTETYTHVTRDPYAPARSTNRDAPKQYDLEVTNDRDQDIFAHSSSTDKDEMENGVSDLGYSSSVVRLTGDMEDDKKETQVRFGA